MNSDSFVISVKGEVSDKEIKEMIVNYFGDKSPKKESHSTILFDYSELEIKVLSVKAQKELERAQDDGVNYENDEEYKIGATALTKLLGTGLLKRS